jgi:transcriptional antiterminator RfaH
MLDTAKTADYSASVSDAGNRAPCGRYWPRQGEIKTRPQGRPPHGGLRQGAGRKPSGSGQADRDRGAPQALGPRWYCVRTGPQSQQLRADIEIRLAGFELFNPSIWKAATGLRRPASGPPRRGLPDRVLPLFPRYVFARFDAQGEDWTVICRLPGVERIIATAPGRPVAVPESALAAVRALCHPNGCIYPAQTAPSRFSRGDQLRITEGPLAGLEGIAHWSDRKRVALLLDLMGRAIRVTLDAGAVRPL